MLLNEMAIHSYESDAMLPLDKCGRATSWTDAHS